MDWLSNSMISLKSSVMLLRCGCLNSCAILGSNSFSTCVNWNPSPVTWKCYSPLDESDSEMSESSLVSLRWIATDASIHHINMPLPSALRIRGTLLVLLRYFNRCYNFLQSSVSGVRWKCRGQFRAFGGKHTRLWNSADLSFPNFTNGYWSSVCARMVLSISR
jgi:hypothetical protein